MRSHKGAGHLVALIHIGQGVIAAKAVAVHNSLHQTADIEEADLILVFRLRRGLSFYLQIQMNRNAS